MGDLKELTDALLAFRDARDWEQFHNPKDLAIALNLEAAELLEAFLWKGADEADPAKIREELADVIGFALLLAHKHGLDVRQIVLDKIKLNEQKYPVEKARGTAKKYTEL